VVARVRIHIRHPRTGKDIELDEIHRYEFGEDGRIVRYRPYTDTAGVIEIYRG
jgi:ketosteroid isomerase-like protein